MPPKRKRDADALLEPENYDAALTVVRRLAKKFALDPALLQADSDGTGVGFSKVTYAQVAPRVGLEASRELKDIQTFDIHRSRIPTDLFRSIVADIDVMLVQYGPPPEHRTKEASSRFFSPIFNHLVMQFPFMLRNDPETVIDGNEGYVKHTFRAFGTVTLLCIQMKFKVGNDVERLEAIAQVIAECEGCDLANTSENSALPIYCILYTGLSFEFFRFKRAHDPPFLRGCFPGDPAHLKRGLQVPDFTAMKTTLPFLLQFRCVCETIFDVMLSAYISGLTAYRGLFEANRTKQGLDKPFFDRSGQALEFAEDALGIFREAEDLRMKGEVVPADTSVQDALVALRRSIGAVPGRTLYGSRPIMTGWDDDQIEKA